MRKIPFFNFQARSQALYHDISEDAGKVMSSGVALDGEYCRALETRIAAYFEVAHAIVVGSATDGLTLALQCATAASRGAVITSAHGFASQVLACSRNGRDALLVDCDNKAFQLDPAKVEICLESNRVGGILAASIHGFPADLEALRSLADAYNVPLVEDFTHSAGASIAGRFVGTFGDISVASIYPTKPIAGISTGGVILTDRDDWALRCRSGRMLGLVNGVAHAPLVHSRMSEIAAGAALRGFEFFEQWRKIRQDIAARYTERIGDRICNLGEGVDGLPAYHHYIIYTKRRDEVREQLYTEAGIQAGVYYSRTLPDQYWDGNVPVECGVLNNSRFHAAHNLALPLWEGLTNEDVDYIAESVLNVSIPVWP